MKKDGANFTSDLVTTKHTNTGLHTKYNMIYHSWYYEHRAEKESITDKPETLRHLECMDPCHTDFMSFMVKRLKTSTCPHLICHAM